MILTCPSYNGLRRPATRAVPWPVPADGRAWLPSSSICVTCLDWSSGCASSLEAIAFWTSINKEHPRAGYRARRTTLIRPPGDHLRPQPAGAPSTPVANRRTALKYERADFDGLRRSFAAISWRLLYSVGVDEAVNSFYTLLESVIVDQVPTVILRRRLPPPPPVVWRRGADRAPTEGGGVVTGSNHLDSCFFFAFTPAFPQERH